MFHIFFGESGWIWLLPHVLKGFLKKIIFERFFPWKVAKNWHFQRKIQREKTLKNDFFYMFHIFFGESGWIWLLPHVLKGFLKKIIFERFFREKSLKIDIFKEKSKGKKTLKNDFFQKSF